MKEADVQVAESESGTLSQVEDDESGGHLDTKADDVSRVKGAGDVQRYVLISEATSRLYLVLAEQTLQRMNIGGRKELENII